MIVRFDQRSEMQVFLSAKSTNSNRSICFLLESSDSFELKRGELCIVHCPLIYEGGQFLDDFLHIHPHAI